MKSFVELPKLKPGDQVAVVSPSAGLPGLFPWVQDLGLERLRSVFNLIPLEYPTTRTMGSTPQDRAKDVMAAFSDTNNKAVFTSIGGDDQIQLIKYLDKQIFIDNPKPFFGYSDNTHLHNFLWGLGIPSYYGCAVMTQLAMQGEMHDATIESLNRALFESGEFEVPTPKEYNEQGLDWSDKSNLMKTRIMEPNEGLYWDGSIDVTGTLWGGCVESLILQATTGVYLPSDEDIENTILYIETAEDIPAHWIVEYLLTGFGERGWLDAFQAILVGRPKAWELNQQNSAEVRAKYRQEQRDTVLKSVRKYNAEMPVVQNLDFGHTDPQIILPSGGKAKVISSEQKIILSY